MADDSYYDDIKYYLTTKNFPSNFTKLAKSAMVKRARKYELEGETLYYKTGNQRLTILTSTAERVEKIVALHSTDPRFHFERCDVYRRLRKVYFWKTMLVDVNEHIMKKCDWCRENASMLAIQCDTEVQVLALILGPFSPTPEGNKYVGVLVEPESGWLEVTLMKTSSAKEFGRFVETVYTLYDWRPVYFVDMEPELVRGIDKELVKRGVLLPNKYTEPDSKFGHKIFPHQCFQPVEGRTHIIDILSSTRRNALHDDEDDILCYSVYDRFPHEFATKLNKYIKAFSEDARISKVWHKRMVKTLKNFRKKIKQCDKEMYVDAVHNHLLLDVESDTESEDS